MKRLLFLSVLFTVSSFYSVFPQELRKIYLNKDDGLFTHPSRIAVFPGDSIQFVAVNGDFDILLKTANEMFVTEDAERKIRINSSSNPNSEILILREQEIELTRYYYQIYCITNTSWPDAPPKIIIVSQ